MKNLFCPLCNKSLSYISYNIYECRYKMLQGFGDMEPHYYVNWNSPSNKGYPFYECALWKNNNTIISLEVSYEQKYSLGIRELNSYTEILNVHFNHEFKPINEIISRLQKLIIFL